MRKLYFVFIFVLLLSFTLGYGYMKDSSNNDKNDDSVPVPQSSLSLGEKVSDPIKKQIAEMTVQEKIGQMVLVGFDGYENDEHAKSMLKDYHIGGFILFKTNIRDAQQLKDLLNSLKELNTVNKLPLFLAVDEEGGSISRLPDEFAAIPASGKIGQKNDPALSYQVGKIIGEELALLGFNMDFAPVLDINSNPNNPVIGDRAFGKQVALVSRLGIQTMKGLQAENIISVVKHFPGHGDTSVDSHLGLPSVNHDLERLRSLELRPFMDAINEGVDAIMIAHLLLPQIDPDNPTSLSETIITELLRDELKFEGVVLTDDLTMGAIAENYDLGEAAVKAVQAGSDIVLVCHDYAKQVTVIKALYKAIANGEVTEERIDESVYRILKLKQKYAFSDEANPITGREEMYEKITGINERIKRLFN